MLNLHLNSTFAHVKMHTFAHIGICKHPPSNKPVGVANYAQLAVACTRVGIGAEVMAKANVHVVKVT